MVGWGLGRSAGGELLLGWQRCLLPLVLRNKEYRRESLVRCGLNCVPPNSYVETPASTVINSEDRAFMEVIQLK